MVEETLPRVSQEETAGMVTMLQKIWRKMEALEARLRVVEGRSQIQGGMGGTTGGKMGVKLTEGREDSFERNQPMAQLKSLREGEDFFTYVDSFVSLVSQVDLSDEEQVEMFVEGFKNNDKKLIRILSPKNLQQAIGFAKVLTSEEEHYKDENKLNDQARSGTCSIAWSVANQKGKGGSKAVPRMIPAVMAGKNSVYQPHHRWFIGTETGEEGAKGWCALCDEILSFGHKCVNMELHSLTLEQTEGGGEVSGSVTQEREEEEAATLSLQALQGKRLNNLIVSNAHMVSEFTYVTSGGCDQQIAEVKQFRNIPDKQFANPWNHDTAQPKGVLIYGLIGARRTLLARIIAQHSDVTVIGVTDSELVQKYTEGGPWISRELFVMARKRVPSVIFMEEMDKIDGIGAVRRKSGRGKGDENIQGIMLEFQNQFDSFEALNKIKTPRTMNNVDALDQVLLMPGQFVMNIESSIPNKEFQRDDLKMHSRVIKSTRIVWTMQGQGYEALYGYSPPIHTLYILRTTSTSKVEHVLMIFNAMLQLMSINIHQAQYRMGQRTDHSVEIGHPGESAVELGCIIGRGLTWKRVIDTASDGVLSGKRMRVTHGGNLMDDIYAAMLATLLTSQGHEYTLDGKIGQRMIDHPSKVRESLSLTLHPPIAVKVLKFKKAFPELEEEVKWQTNFVNFYAYALRYCGTEEGQRRTSIKINGKLSDRVLENQLKAQMSYLMEYLKTRYDSKVICMIQWQMWDPKAVIKSTCSIYIEVLHDTLVGKGVIKGGVLIQEKYKREERGSERVGNNSEIGGQQNDNMLQGKTVVTT